MCASATVASLQLSTLPEAPADAALPDDDHGDNTPWLRGMDAQPPVG